MDQKLEVRVKAVIWETPDIRLYDLRPLDGGTLPPFTAGAHIDLHLPMGLARSYSLSNAQDERHRYVVGVAKDAMSRGGSRYIHERLSVGDVISISAPRNNFPLDEAAPHTVLLSGGIGVTPMMSMARRLTQLGRSWHLHYCARNRAAAAFLDDLLPQGDHVSWQFDDECNGRFLDMVALVREAPPDTHFYCCGPTGMLGAFEAAVAGLAPERVHVEYFSAKEEASTDGGFLVELARSNKVIAVAEGKTILEALQDAGIDVPYSCMEGVCGSCETRVLAGTPDHRDAILTDSERASNKTMMVCCSGSKSEKLVLDL
jgi:vanillate O-demethylase ferredoxin subunit